MIERITEDGEITRVPFLRTAFNYDTNEASEGEGLVNDEPSKTQQQFKEEVDINTIVERFGLTGELPANVKMPVSGDFTNVVTDYQTALNMVIEAEQAFMEMPANVRKEFDNDPQKFMEFVENPDNKDRAEKLGILKPGEPVAEPMLVRLAKEDPPEANP